MSGDFALRSRRVLVEGEGGPGALADRVLIAERGRIAALLAPDDPRAIAAQPEDLGDLVLMPGLCDSHVHVNEPGRSEWEGFDTATRAAAAGGVTALVDMPLNCRPVTTTAAALGEKLAACEGKLWVDCGFWGGVVPDNAARAGDLEQLARAGALGCKAFLCPSGIDDFAPVGPNELRAAMPELARVGVPLLVHAEVELAASGAKEPPERYARYLASRPPEWEHAAVSLMIRLCRDTGCAVHVVHLSSAGALPAIAAALSEGLPLSAETCPHYLCLRAEDVPDRATEFKCAPPIRAGENRERLWAGVKDGLIRIVVTDHSPCTPSLKLPDRGDFLAAWGGIASLGLGLPAVWTEASARGLSIADVALLMSRRPAELAGLGDKKGRMLAGYDADVVAWDPDASFTPTGRDLHQRHRISPYLGRALRGRVRATWLRGEKVYANDVHLGAPRGRPLLGRAA